MAGTHCAVPEVQQLLCPFCCNSTRRAMQTHCLHPQHCCCCCCCTKQPSSTHLSGLRRQVIRPRCLQPGRAPPRHHLMCILAAKHYYKCMYQLFLFCNCRDLQAGGGASAGWDSIIRPTQVLRMYPDSSGLGNSNCADCAYSETQNLKRPVVAPKLTNFELITKDYQEHKSRLQIFIDST